MKMRYAALAASAVAGLAVFGLAPAASANDVVVPPAGTEPPNGSACTVQRDWGQACFQIVGDKVWVLGTHHAMGLEVVAVWGTSDGDHGECVNRIDQGRWMYCDYSLDEGNEIVFRAELRDGDEVLDRTPWAEAGI